MYNPCDDCKFKKCKLCDYFEAQSQIKIYRKQEKGYHKQEDKMMNCIKNLQHELVQTRRLVNKSSKRGKEVR